jgi:hypothetical protein
MAHLSNRESTVHLVNPADHRGWREQLEARCVAHNIWDQISLDATAQLLPKPVAIRVPLVSEYTPANNIETPTRASELSVSGQKAFKEDLEYYKLLHEQYKSDRHEYEKQQASLQHIVSFIQSTVSPHLLRTCCSSKKPIRQWIIDIQRTTGMSDQLEQEQARNRYRASLKPMRNPQQWDTWLAEYDEAAAEAEACQAVELQQVSLVTKDFIDAVNKAAPIWSTNFQDNGRFAVGMTRKEMIQRFREHMMTNYPLRPGKHKAFIADGTLFHTVDGATTQSNDGDAYQAKGATPSSNRGRPRNQRGAGRTPTTLKRPLDQGPATAAQGAKCPACGQRHTIRDCYYVNPDKAPEWWIPNETINELIQFKREKDSTFQGLIRGQSRPCSQTPITKYSHTPTPEIPEV